MNWWRASRNSSNRMTWYLAKIRKKRKWSHKLFFPSFSRRYFCWFSFRVKTSQLKPRSLPSRPNIYFSSVHLYNQRRRNATLNNDKSLLYAISPDSSAFHYGYSTNSNPVSACKYCKKQPNSEIINNSDALIMCYTCVFCITALLIQQFYSLLFVYVCVRECVYTRTCTFPNETFHSSLSNV